ncbi:MAG: hypothetical protein JW841_12435 [Deltaproteobacteria bacterium]|nr:hypothetical protein [Deltaproteobacteria bacterium]
MQILHSFKRLLLCGVTLLTLTIVGDTIAIAAEAESLVNQSETQWRLEAGVVIPDLRQFYASALCQKQRLIKSRVGKAYYAKTRPGEIATRDYVDELKHFIDLVDSGNEQIPAQLSFITREAADDLETAKVSWQLAIKVSSGFAKRLHSYTKAENNPLFTIKDEERPNEQQWQISTEFGQAIATLSDDNFLRVSSLLQVTKTKLPPPKFSEDISKWIEGDTVTAFIQGAGRIAKEMSEAASGERQLRRAIKSMEAVTFGLQMVKDGSVRARICAASANLLPFAAMIRKPILEDFLTPSFGPEAMTILTATIPPVALQPLPELIVKELEDEKVPSLSAQLKESLGQLDGRIGIATFGSPNDWVLGITMKDNAAANTIVPELETWLHKLFLQEVPKLDNLIAKATNLAGASQGFVVQPDPELAGFDVVAIGRTVYIVMDKARVSSLVKINDAISNGHTNKNLAAAGPLTPTVRATVDRPAVLSAYSVNYGDGTLGAIAAWLVRALDLSKKDIFNELPESARAYLQRLPITMSMLSLQSLLLYDLAFSININGPVVVIEASTSEI